MKCGLHRLLLSDNLGDHLIAAASDLSACRVTACSFLFPFEERQIIHHNETGAGLLLPVMAADPVGRKDS